MSGSPIRSEQLAALLAYCREMNLTEFFRSADAATAVPAPADGQPPMAVPAAPAPAVKPAPPATASPTLMPPNLDQLASLNRTAPTDAPLPPAQRAAALDAIRQEIGDCTRCPLAFAGRSRIVFGNGDPNAELLFVGEGPGADEDEQGEPFVGRAGQLLNNMIGAMGLRREQVYVANIVKCRPPKNRVPEPTEALTCSPFLFRQIGVVRPKLIVALGATAATYMLGTRSALSLLRGRMHDCLGARLIVTYHPAYLLRDPRQKAEAWKDLQLAMRFLNLKPPKRPGA